MRSKKMERLLFESKGAPTKAVVMSSVVCLELQKPDLWYMIII